MSAEWGALFEMRAGFVVCLHCGRRFRSWIPTTNHAKAHARAGLELQREAIVRQRGPRVAWRIRPQDCQEIGRATP